MGCGNSSKITEPETKKPVKKNQQINNLKDFNLVAGSLV